MTVREMPLEDLELLSYPDIAYELLKLDKKPKTTPVLFGEVCRLLEIPEDAMFEMIGDFYTTLTTDKRFLLLDSAEWDLKEFHAVKKIVIDDDDDEDIVVEAVSEDSPEEIEDEAVVEDAADYDDSDDDMDDLGDLVVVTEEELED